MSTSIRIARNNVDKLTFMFATIPVGIKRYCVKYELAYWTARLSYLIAVRRSKKHAMNRAPSLTCAIDTVCVDAYHEALQSAERDTWKIQGLVNART